MVTLSNARTLQIKMLAGKISQQIDRGGRNSGTLFCGQSPSAPRGDTRAPDYSSNLCPLKYDLYDFFRADLGLLPLLFLV